MADSIGTGRLRWTAVRASVSLFGLVMLLFTGCGSDGNDGAAPSDAGITDASFEIQQEIGGRVLGGTPVEDPTTPEGVFVLVTLFFQNGPDAAVTVRDGDFLLLDEDGRSHTISSEGTQAYVRSRLGLFQELELEWIDADAVVKQLGGTPSERPSPSFSVVPDLTMSDLPKSDAAYPTPTPFSDAFEATEFSEEGLNVLYEDLRLELSQEVGVIAVFDIPGTGTDRSLKVRFGDQEPVGLISSEDCDPSAAPKCRR